MVGLLSVAVVKVRMGFMQAEGIFSRCNRRRAMVFLGEAMIDYSRGGGHLLVPMPLYFYL